MVEHFLELVGRHHGQAGKLLRLQAFLREEAAQQRVSDPRRSYRLMRQACDLTGEILRARAMCDELALRVCRLIERLPDQTEREALKLCYLLRLSARNAAAALGCSTPEACRIKQRALMHLEELMD